MTETMEDGRIRALRRRHAELAREVEAAEKSSSTASHEIYRLKAEKLRLKEAIERYAGS